MWRKPEGQSEQAETNHDKNKIEQEDAEMEEEKRWIKRKIEKVQVRVKDNARHEYLKWVQDN